MTEPGVPTPDPLAAPNAEPPAAVPVAADGATPVAEAVPVAIPALTDVPAPEAVPAAEAREPPPAPKAVRARWPRNRRSPKVIPGADAPAEKAEPTAAEVPAPPAAWPALETGLPAPVALPPTAAIVPTASPAANGPPAPDLLDERLRRLEDVLTKLADSRVTDRAPEPPPPPPPEPPNPVLEAGKQLLPAAIGALSRPMANYTPGFSQPEPRSPWLLFDIVTEMRSILHMYGDPRYRLTWNGRVIPVVMLAFIFTSWIWLPGTTLFPTWFTTTFDKVLDLVFAYFLFKVLSREARRYRETIPPSQPPGLRL